LALSISADGLCCLSRCDPRIVALILYQEKGKGKRRRKKVISSSGGNRTEWSQDPVPIIGWGGAKEAKRRLLERLLETLFFFFFFSD
jgi:hypothetical protein